MRTFYPPIAIVIGGTLLYHFSQKSIPKTADPLYTLVAAYAIGIVICVACAPLMGSGRSLLASLKESNWAVLTLGIAVVAIEIGFLFAYRAGWKLSAAAIASNVAVAVLLIPIGLLAFKEQLSIRNVLGLIFCIVGFVLVARE